MSEKILSIYANEDHIGESEAFFNGDKLIAVIDANDAQYRHEYMKCLFSEFGVSVEYLTTLSATQATALREFGYE